MVKLNYKILTKENFVYDMPEETYDDVNAARQRWLQLNSMEYVVGLRHEITGLTRRVVRVVFPGKSTEWTYETPIAVKKGQWVIVLNKFTGGPNVATAVTNDYETLESELGFDPAELKKIVAVAKRIA